MAFRFFDFRSLPREILFFVEKRSACSRADRFEIYSKRRNFSSSRCFSKVNSTPRIDISHFRDVIVGLLNMLLVTTSIDFDYETRLETCAIASVLTRTYREI